MAAPDPEGFSLLEKVVGAATAIAVPIGAAYKLASSALAKKADRHLVNSQFQTVNNELSIQRNHIGKIFDKLDEHSRRDETLFRELMTKMGDHHAEVMKALGDKADR